MRVSREIVDAISMRWPCLHIEGFDEDEAEEIIESCLMRLRGLLVAADSELSAIAHGRPPSSKDELEQLYWGIRGEYESKNGRPSHAD